MAELKEFDREKLKRLFDQQVKTLITKGFYRAAKMSASDFRQFVEPVSTLLPETINVPLGHAPFIVVVPPEVVSLEKQVGLMELNGKLGYYYESLILNAIQNSNGLIAPCKPYLIFGVEDGKANLGISANDCSKKFKGQGRSGLITVEGIALVVQFPEVIRNHYILLVGSRYHSIHVPYIGLPNQGKFGERPCVGWIEAKSAYDLWGGVSCSHRSTDNLQKHSFN